MLGVDFVIRFGIIGTSNIAERFITAAKLIEDFEAVAVYSRNEENGRSFASKFGISTVFTNLEELAKSDNIDAVYIASPNSLHSAQSIICMNGGKHVLCEKAVASNTKELRASIESAEKNNVLFMEAIKTLFLPNYKAALDNLHKLGKLRKFFASYCQYSSRYDKYKAGELVNTFNPQFSNGSIMDIGVYCIHAAVRFLGVPKGIKAIATMLPSGVDGEGSLILKYDEMEAAIIHSKITESQLPIEIQGELGTMQLDKVNNTEKVTIKYINGEIEELTVPQIVDNMYYEALEFITLIKNNITQSSISSHNHSLVVMDVLDKARAQAGIVFPADKA